MVGIDLGPRLRHLPHGLCFFFGLRAFRPDAGAGRRPQPAVIVITAWLIGKERMTPMQGIGSLIASPAA